MELNYISGMSILKFKLVFREFKYYEFVFKCEEEIPFIIDIKEIK